jgi:hypothetical protein
MYYSSISLDIQNWNGLRLADYNVSQILSMSISGPDVSITIGCSKIITLAGFHIRMGTLCTLLYVTGFGVLFTQTVHEQPRRKSLMYLEGGLFFVIRLTKYSLRQIALFCKIPMVKDATPSDR